MYCGEAAGGAEAEVGVAGGEGGGGDVGGRWEPDGEEGDGVEGGDGQGWKEEQVVDCWDGGSSIEEGQRCLVPGVNVVRWG